MEGGALFVWSTLQPTAVQGQQHNIIYYQYCIYPKLIASPRPDIFLKHKIQEQPTVLILYLQQLSRSCRERT